MKCTNYMEQDEWAHKMQEATKPALTELAQQGKITIVHDSILVEVNDFNVKDVELFNKIETSLQPLGRWSSKAPNYNKG